MAAKARTIIQEQRATATLDAECARFSGLSEVYRGLEWRISRDPKAGYCIPGSDPATYVIRSKEWVNTPSLVLLYRFTDDEVTILAARIHPLQAKAAAREESEESAAS
jgi:hypothetical protein